ncbi:glycoside hydrolase family 43 protein [Balneolales bacterium ANBcel1]|nr:glycoside hydrolase family 43 protein [Balneolales bacterium ANBcel1]
MNSQGHVCLPLLAGLAVAVLSVLPGCGPDSDYRAAPEAGVPAFHWFEYTGQDTVFEQFVPGEDEYQNPLIAGFYPDPSIIRHGADYFMVHSTFSVYPGIPLFHSRDLVNWTQIGHVLDRPSQLDLEGLEMSYGVFAPTINYHDGTFYVLSTVVNGGGNFLVTSEDPSVPGSWSEPVWLTDVQGIDPSIFFDDDGTIYILNNGPPEGEPLYEGHRALWIQEYDPETQTTGPDQVIVDGGVDITQEPIWIEAPHLKKIDGQYLLIAAEGGTGHQHSQVAFRADSPTGPYVPYEGNPILTQRHLDRDRPFPVDNTGHADIVETQNGEWWAVFLGVRPYEGTYFNTGRETFMLPVEWTDDGWPIILKGDETVPYTHPRPDLPLQDTPEIPLTGNFTLLDTFEEDELALYWSFIRTPTEKWYELDNGMLKIQPRPVHISDGGNPSFIGRRLQHARAIASTAMTYRPSAPGDAAGMVAFQRENNYFFLGVTLEEGAEQPVIQLEKRSGDTSGGTTVILASKPLEYDTDSPVYLRIEAREDEYDFYYSLTENRWELLYEGADGKVLSTERAGGFIGSFFGMYSYSEN